VKSPPYKHTATDFVEIVCEGALEHYYWHYNQYKHLILMEGGAPLHHSKAQKFWREELGLTKLKWPTNSLDLNPIDNIWKQTKDQVQKRH